MNVNILRQVSVAKAKDEGAVLFHDQGAVDTRILAGHDTAPTVVDWDRDGRLDLVVGAEDGHFYYLDHPGRGN